MSSSHSVYYYYLWLSFILVLVSLKILCRSIKLLTSLLIYLVLIYRVYLSLILLLFLFLYLLLFYYSLPELPLESLSNFIGQVIYFSYLILYLIIYFLFYFYSTKFLCDISITLLLFFNMY